MPRSLKSAFLSCLLCAASTAAFATPANNAAKPVSGGNSCSIASLTDLGKCVTSRASYKELSFEADIQCDGGNCCAGDALLVLDNSQNLRVRGNGHTLLRRGNHKQCSALSLRNAQHLIIENLAVQEGDEQSCSPAEKPCDPAIIIGNSHDVTLDGLALFDAKGFGITVSGSDGVVIRNSAITATGIIGVYVGLGSSGQPSNHIKILNSVIAHSDTNAICFEGVVGESQSDNEIGGNIIVQNHHHGVYLDPSGRPFNGGQIYLPNVTNATVHDNLIGLGYCANCNNHMVWGVELGPKKVDSVTFRHNVFFDSDGVAYFHNTGTPLTRTTTFKDSVVRNSTGLSLDSSANGLNGAEVESNKTVGDPIGVQAGTPQSGMARVVRGGRHIALAPRGAESAGTIEANFRLSPAPRPGASFVPFLECDSSAAVKSFTCNGSQAGGVLGFSYEKSYPGAKAFFECDDGKDHFFSWDPKCEGKRVIADAGYALPAANG
jgi:Right handed beta helix region